MVFAQMQAEGSTSFLWFWDRSPAGLKSLNWLWCLYSFFSFFLKHFNNFKILSVARTFFSCLYMCFQNPATIKPPMIQLPEAGTCQIDFFTLTLTPGPHNNPLLSLNHLTQAAGWLCIHPFIQHLFIHRERTHTLAHVPLSHHCSKADNIWSILKAPYRYYKKSCDCTDKRTMPKKDTSRQDQKRMGKPPGMNEKYIRHSTWQKVSLELHQSPSPTTSHGFVWFNLMCRGAASPPRWQEIGWLLSMSAPLHEYRSMLNHRATLL